MGLLSPHAGHNTFVGLSLRKANFEDLPMLGEIRRQAIMAQPETFWSHEEKLKAADAWATMDVQNNYAQYKIFMDENANYFIGWKFNYIGYLFLTPKVQNEGIGSKILKFAEDEIRKDYDHAWLFAHPYSHRFYEKHGYIKQAETEDAFGTKPLFKFQKNFG